MKKFVKELKQYSKSIYSQNGEDGILLEIFNRIGLTNKYFVEFGAWDGLFLSNTANLRINHGWKGLLLEGSVDKISEEVTHGFVTAENINQIFADNNVPETFDLLSIDIDSDDYWCWEACNYNPRVVIIEYQSSLDPTIPLVSEKGKSVEHSYFGASISALKKLGQKKGYSLVFRCNQQNLIFVKSELLNEEERDIPLEMFINENNQKIYHDGVYKPHWNEYADNKIWEYFKLNYDYNWQKV